MAAGAGPLQAIYKKRKKTFIHVCKERGVGYKFLIFIHFQLLASLTRQSPINPLQRGSIRDTHAYSSSGKRCCSYGESTPDLSALMKHSNCVSRRCPWGWRKGERDRMIFFLASLSKKQNVSEKGILKKTSFPGFFLN